jgi:hypothetical protein
MPSDFAVTAVDPFLRKWPWFNRNLPSTMYLEGE